MKGKIIRILSALLCALTVFSCFAITTSAEAFTYRKGANNVSDSYKGSRYYNNLTQIQLTGDGVTDLLAVAISQLGYIEGKNQDGFYGSQEGGGSGNYTEYCYNMGSVGGYAYAWCAAFVSWSLLQSRCTDQNTQGAWCRNHEGDKNYIWREVGCYRWYNQLKRFGYGHADDGSYTPKSGDLIFFESSEHIGIVRYSKNGRVYTIEGNTKGGEGVASEGGGVYCKNYKINSSDIRGYGSLPLKSNANAPKVDYSGENPTTGLWISGTAKYLYADSNLSGTYKTIPKGTAFEVTKIVSKTCYQVKYYDNVGYVSVNSDSPIYQFTSTAPATGNSNNNNSSSESGTTTEKATEAAVTPNKYAISADIKKVKEHVGSGITKYTIDGANVNASEAFALNAGETIGVQGFAGFTSNIRDFGYYFDGNAENAVWNTTPKEPNADAKKKAGAKAKMFDIIADTTSLANGEHTVTFVTKFVNNKTCDLITLNLNVGGSNAGCADGSESSSESGEAEDGCKSSIAVGIVLPISIFAGAILIKKKKED